MSLESPIKAIPMESRLLCPPDSVLTYSFYFSIKPISSIIFFTVTFKSFFETPLKLA